MFWTIVAALLAAQAILYLIGPVVIGLRALFANDWPQPPRWYRKQQAIIEEKRHQARVASDPAYRGDWVRRQWATSAGLSIVVPAFLIAFGVHNLALVAVGVAATVILQLKGARARAGL